MGRSIEGSCAEVPCGADILRVRLMMVGNERMRGVLFVMKGLDESELAGAIDVTSHSSYM